VLASAAEDIEDASNVDAAYETLDSAAREVLGEPLSTRVDREAVEAALDPIESVGSRDSVGGPAPAQTESSLTRAEDRLDADRDTVEQRRAALQGAETELGEEVTTRV
jgi:argininosuccinate lyase